MSIKVWVAACWCATALAFAHNAVAANVVWVGNRFVYATNGSDIVDTLNIFAADQGIPVRVSGHVTGVVSGRFAMPPQGFLDALCASFGLVWYYDGAVLQVSPANEQRTVAIRPNYLTPAALAAALEQAGVSDPRFAPQPDASGKFLMVHGPSAYVDSVSAAGRRFEDDARDHAHTSVRLVKLVATTAADHTRVIGTRTVTVPGTATLVRQRFAIKHRASVATGADETLEYGAPLPIIEADAPTNSILIRDRPDRIEADAEVVAQVDSKTDLVSIETYVVAVDPAELATLQTLMGEPLPPPAAPPPPSLFASLFRSSSKPVDVPAQLTLAADGGRALLLRLNVLELAQRAELQLRRTAVTIDHTPAVLDRHEVELARIGDDPIGETPLQTSAQAQGDLSLAIVAVASGAGAGQQIDLHVELGNGTQDTDGSDGGAVSHHKRPVQSVGDAQLAPGEGLIMVPPLPAGGDPSARRRVVLLIPRVVA